MLQIWNLEGAASAGGAEIHTMGRLGFSFETIIPSHPTTHTTRS